MKTIKIKDIKPAKYNPRKITDEAFVDLQGSLKTLGFILPIIVNSDNMTIVAGHQRTKAATAVGITDVPAYFVSGVTMDKEIMFNQVHNGIETEPDVHGIFRGSLETGNFYDNVPNGLFEIPKCQATRVKDICLLLTQYGDALCAIVCGNEVIFGNNYIKAAQACNFPIHVYSLEKEKKMMFEHYFSKNYGQFSYEHIDRNDYVQGLAQMVTKTINHSGIYRIAMPFITSENNKKLHILDFGCGKALSIGALRKDMNYVNAIGLEFFNHNKKGIAIEKGHEMIDKLIAHVQRYGKFDYVICDSVLNSVNSQKAENSVIACLCLFCKLTGKIFFCGRTIESVKSLDKAERNTTNNMYTHNYTDEHGLVSYMREGQWYFQKFLSKEDVDGIINRFKLDVFTQKRDSSMWYIGATKKVELPDNEYMDAIDFEFNMKLPNNQRYGRHNDIRKLFGYPPLEGE